MKRSIALVYPFLICMAIQSIARTPYVDSLRSMVICLKDGREKIDKQLELANRFTPLSVDSSIAWSETARNLARKLKYQEGTASASAFLGFQYWAKADLQAALRNFETALGLYRQLNDKPNTAAVLEDIGDICSNTGLYDYPRSLEAYNKAFLIKQQLRDQPGMASVLLKTGALYCFMGEHEKGIDLDKRALELFRRTGDVSNIANVYIEIGRTCTWGQQYLSADRYIDSAIFILSKLDDSERLNNCSFMKGLNELHQQKFRGAIYYFERSIAGYKKYGEIHNLGITLDFVANAYVGIKNYGKALERASEGLKLGERHNDLTLQLKAAEALTMIYELSGDYKSALNAHKLASMLNDSVQNSRKTKEIAKHEAEFDFKQKEMLAKAAQDKKDALALAELKKQKFIRNATGAGLAGVILFSVVLYRQRNKISNARKRSDELLLNILPAETAEELKATGEAKTRSFDCVTVLFTDFKDFTKTAEQLSPEEIVREINYCYSAFDDIMTRHGLEKIKTIGDSYMCAGGLPVANETHAVDAVRAAIDILGFILKEKQRREAEGRPYFDIRIGLHSGPVVAGIVGVKKFAYDIWGDTVNTASRLEHHGEAGKINISGSTYELVKHEFTCTHRGKIQAKNKGEIDMYFVNAG